MVVQVNLLELNNFDLTILHSLHFVLALVLVLVKYRDVLLNGSCCCCAMLLIMIMLVLVLLLMMWS